MKRLTSIKTNPINRMKELIGIRLLTDDVVRGLSTESALTFNTLNSDWTGLTSRPLSSAVRRSLEIIKGDKISAGYESSTIQDRVGSNLAALAETRTILDVLGTYLKTEGEIKSIREQIDALPDDKESGKKKMALQDEVKKLENGRTSVDNVTNNLWRDSSILDFIALRSTIENDAKDDMNDILLSSFLSDNDAFGDRWAKFSRNYFHSYKVTGGGDAPSSSDPYDISNLAGLLDIKQFVPTNGVNDLDISKLFSLIGTTPASDKGAVADALEIMTYLQDLELCNLVDKLGSMLPSLEKVTTTKLSDNKNINTLLTEAERVHRIYELRLFVTLQPWVALMQVYTQMYFGPALVEAFIEAHPQVDATFDVKGVLGSINDKVVGPNTAAILSNISKVSEIKIKNAVYSCLNIQASLTHEKGFTALFGELKKVVAAMYALSKNAALWEAYANGAAMHGSAKLTIESMSMDAHSPLLCLTQFGHLSGDVPRSFGTYSSTMFIDHGFNRFNSSSLTEVVLSDAESSITVIPYTFGVIDYADYRKNIVPHNIKTVLQSKVASGPDVAAISLPVLAMRRATPPNWMAKFWIDKPLTGWGPVSLLPVPPVTLTSIKSGHGIETITKQVVGKFETKLESFPMEFQHSKHIIELNIPAAESQLAEVLGISSSYVTRDKNIPTQMRKFFQMKNKTEVLVCPFITRDSFFSDAAGTIFYIPYFEGTPDVAVLYMGYNSIASANGTTIHDVKTEPIRIARLLKGSTNTSTSPVPNRILTPMIDFTETFRLNRGPKRKSLNITSLD